MSNQNLSFDFASPSSTSRPSSRRQARSASQAARVRSSKDSSQTDSPNTKTTAPKSSDDVPVASPKSKATKALVAKEKNTKLQNVVVPPSAKTTTARGRKPEKQPTELSTTQVSAVKKVRAEKAVKVQKAVEVQTEKPLPEKSITLPKAKRVRAPKNLAAQYGEIESANQPRPTAEILLEPPKKSRRTAKARAKRQEAMQVDDDLLQRLARVGSASSLVIGEPETPTKARRSRIWEVMCGKCGHEQKSKTPATLCDGCGTILLREAAHIED